MSFWRKTSSGLRSSVSRSESDPSDKAKIEILESAGVVRVRDPRLFRQERRGWCRILAEAAICHPRVRAVQLDLEAAVCEIQFDDGPAAPSAIAMAEVLAASIRQADGSAVPLSCPPKPRKPRTGWWSRKSQDWTHLAAFPRNPSCSIWEARIKVPGLIELGHEALSVNTGRSSGLIGELLARSTAIDACQLDPRTRGLLAQYAPGQVEISSLLDHAEQALKACPPGRLAALSDDVSVASIPGEPTMLVAGPRRILYLTLGGVAFAMIVVGLAIPGIPTVTFLMVSSYYLVRSSTRLYDRLVRSRFFGPVIREWTLRHGLSRRSKGKLAGLTLAAIGASFVLVGITPIVLTVTFVLSSAGLFSLIRLPEVEAEKALGSASWTRIPLPAPSV